MLTPPRFIGEPITVAFDTPPVLEKKPDCPDAFHWREETDRVVEVIEKWTDHARHGRFARNMQPEHAKVAGPDSALAEAIVPRDASPQPEDRAPLYEAVEREDALRYDEPPDWIQPVRHALGATLMQEGRYADAERVYREDLYKLPDNGWSLFGLARALRLQKREDEAEEFEDRFARGWKDADTKLKSSCFCQPGV